VLKLRRYAAPMVEICEELQRLDFPFIDKKMRPYFRDVAIHVIPRLLEDLNCCATSPARPSRSACCWSHRGRAWCSASSPPGRPSWLADGGRRHLRHELPEHAGAALALRLFSGDGAADHCLRRLYISFKQADWL
jgi:magnesium transporter